MIEQQAEILEELGLIDSEGFNAEGFNSDEFSIVSDLEEALEETVEPVKEKPQARIFSVPKKTYENIPPAERNQEELFRELISTHQKRLYRFVIKYIDHPDDAADITQQAFVEAARTIANFRGDSKLSTWLFGIAMNMVRNYFLIISLLC